MSSIRTTNNVSEQSGRSEAGRTNENFHLHLQRDAVIDLFISPAGERLCSRAFKINITHRYQSAVFSSWTNSKHKVSLTFFCWYFPEQDVEVIVITVRVWWLPNTETRMKNIFYWFYPLLQLSSLTCLAVHGDRATFFFLLPMIIILKPCFIVFVYEASCQETN